jgi:STE24 endopeptidase
MAFLLALFIIRFAVDTLADLLNLTTFRKPLPAEFLSVYEPEKYAEALRYQMASSRFELIRSSVSMVVFLTFWCAGGFNFFDQWVRGFGFSTLWTGLLFVGVLSLLRGALQLPFSIYDTFVLEEKFGFNRTTPATFVGDLFKGILLGSILGGAIFAGICAFFENVNHYPWLWAWLAFVLFQVLLLFIAPVWIMPLFNKFSPIDNAALKEGIKLYTDAQSFQLNGVFTMDSSKRSTKGNAFFTGFGKYRRLVLFDTLIQSQSVSELVAVVAHEIGHFKLKHIQKSIIFSMFGMLVIFYGFSWAVSSPWLFDAFGIGTPSTYAGIVLASLAYSPFFRVVGIVTHALSRKNEFEADRFAVETYGHSEELVSALKKLSRDNLSNLHPHPLKVLLDYTHPPILQRIAVLKSL